MSGLVHGENQPRWASPLTIVALGGLAHVVNKGMGQANIRWLKLGNSEQRAYRKGDQNTNQKGGQKATQKGNWKANQKGNKKAHQKHGQKANQKCSQNSDRKANRKGDRKFMHRIKALSTGFLNHQGMCKTAQKWAQKHCFQAGLVPGVLALKWTHGPTHENFQAHLQWGGLAQEKHHGLAHDEAVNQLGRALNKSWIRGLDNTESRMVAQGLVPDPMIKEQKEKLEDRNCTAVVDDYFCWAQRAL
ncbi:hypothetical protein DFH08DRAFT_814531 [Mycena albidolilacea]|uniref:Uncharacterized protein n=1 Tax=Mycena albidolilacea TaxID=1033008 RepID=A0AAD7EJY6_9AGAR|nr:hypothetical protein DFH08DRAFT_814531 [Mycena albidolilacea]